MVSHSFSSPKEVTKREYLGINKEHALMPRMFLSNDLVFKDENFIGDSTYLHTNPLKFMKIYLF